jgi:hypothetical protein
MRKKWIAQGCIGLVILSNLYCAVLFLFSPALYALGYELFGVPGEIAIRGFGLLFVMWSVPYFFAAFNPFRYRISLYEAVIMQSIGLIGESTFWLNLPAGHSILHSSILRFIIFDGAGLVFLLLAFLLTRAKNVPSSK